ncbi:MAG: exosortase 1 [Candidatus Acidoferrum typicum]|nr:exosortase 1 [Candidatus Acidoferrum typicum]
MAPDNSDRFRLHFTSMTEQNYNSAAQDLTLISGKFVGRIPTTWLVQAIFFFVALSALLYFHWATFISLVSMWRTLPFSHGFAVVPVTAWLISKRRALVCSTAPTPAFWSLLPLALLSALWLGGNLTNTAVVQQFCFVAMIIVLVWAEFGSQLVRKLLFPLAFLFFMVPAGENLIPTLQGITASLSVAMLHLSGVPVHVQGNIISVPSGNWEIEAYCSGISYLFSSLAIGSLYAAVSFRSWTRRGIILLLSVAVPILANGLRVYGVILASSFGSDRISGGIEHYLYGWLFFCIVLSLFLLLTLPLREEDRESELNVEPAQPGAFAPSIETGRGSAPNYLLRTVTLTAIAVLCMAIAPRFGALAAEVPNGQASWKLSPPSVNESWSPTSWDASGWSPRFVSGQSGVSQAYESRDGQKVLLYAAYYGSREPGVKLVSTGNRIFNGTTWWRVEDQGTYISLEGQNFLAHRYLIRSETSFLCIWQWYWAGGRFTGNPLLAKFLLAKDRLLRKDRGSAIILLVTTADREGGDCDRLLTEFANHLAVSPVLNAPLRIKVPSTAN